MMSSILQHVNENSFDEKIPDTLYYVLFNPQGQTSFLP